MIDALYFDGRSARGQPVRLYIEGHELCAAAAPPAFEATFEATSQRWPLHQVVWPERSRHGQRVVQLRSGGSFQIADAAAFDRWRSQTGARESWVVRVQQNWRATVAAIMGLMLVLAAGYRWGVPAAAQLLVHAVPLQVDRAVGETALAQVRSRWLKPSTLPAARQAWLRARFAQAVASAFKDRPVPAYELHFMAADKTIGPNAFALPGGSIVVTDALVELLHGADDTLLGVLAHELGHVQHRHGMRGLVQFGLVSAAASVALGDFSTLLAAVPAVLAQMAYSRDAERESDAEAARVLRAAGKSPDAMVVLFERLAHSRSGEPRPPLALASHPMDEERAQFFRDAARAR